MLALHAYRRAPLLHHSSHWAFRRDTAPPPRLGAALLAGHRRIGGRWHRAVARVAVDLALQLLDALAQLRDLRNLGKQLAYQFPGRLTAGEGDLLRLFAPHGRKFCSHGRNPAQAGDTP
jgi:hypothetical protein